LNNKPKQPKAKPEFAQVNYSAAILSTSPTSVREVGVKAGVSIKQSRENRRNRKLPVGSKYEGRW
jgi:hypothetical protein